MTTFGQLKQQRKAKENKFTVSALSDVRCIPNTEPCFNQDDNIGIIDNDPSSGPIPYKTDLYSGLPSTLDIRIKQEEGGNGRGIYTRYHRKPGDILLSMKPHVAALSNDNLEGYCSNCFGGGSKLRRCTGCKALHYCDAACQTADWPLHKQECNAIQRWASISDSGPSTVPGDAIRCIGRMLWRKQKVGRASTWARELDAMESHRSSLSKDPNSRDSQVYTQLAHAIVRFLGLNSPQESAEYGMDSAADLVDLVSRFTTNTFTISTPALAPLGACVSPLVALINHSCDPNAVVVFPRAVGESAKEQEPLMQVIALKHMSPDEEILTAYVDVTLPADFRRKVLRETYHFTCRCVLCAPPANSPVDLRQAMWCPKKCGRVCPLPTEESSLTRCSKCRAPVKDTDAVLDAVRVGQEALDKAEALQFSNPQKSIQLTTNLMPILISAGLVPGAHPLLALARLNSSLLIADLPSPDSPEADVEEVRSPQLQTSIQSKLAPKNATTPQEAQEALDEAIRAATRASTGLSQILVEGHPVRGLALAELGKLLAVDEPYPAHLMSNVKSQSLAEESPLALNNKPLSYPPSGPQRLKLAYETLVRARMELGIGFGGGRNEGGEVGKGVRELAVDLEKELAVWRTRAGDALEDAKAVGVKAKK